MAKHNKRPRLLPLPSGSSTTPVDLFLLAGLPNPIHGRCEKFLQKLAGRYSKVVTSSSTSNDGPLYRQSTVDSLLRGSAEFAIRRLKNRSDDQSARPRRIALFYVPATDDHRLIDAFDFFVFPIAMHELAVFDHTGHQVRHKADSCEAEIKRAFEAYNSRLLGFVQQKIESRKSSEPLLLPPVNFHLPQSPLRNVFCELTRGTRAWQNAIPEEIVPRRFDKAMLPKFLDHQEHQLIFQDARDIVFPCARASELHGAQDIDRSAAVSELCDILRSTYRFGVSLPQGFHHDAQFEGGREFKDTPFTCSRNGPITVNGTHANIYPNDYVRESE